MAWGRLTRGYLPPRAVPWSVYPAATTPNTPANHCAAGKTECTAVLAGFPFGDLPSNPNLFQYKKYNDFLLTWFNRALDDSMHKLRLMDGIYDGKAGKFIPDPDADFESSAWKDQPTCQICIGVDSEKVLALYAKTLALAGQ